MPRIGQYVSGTAPQGDVGALITWVVYAGYLRTRITWAGLESGLLR
jgi:hypothetical protein